MSPTSDPDNPYEGLLGEGDDRWAFGTGFEAGAPDVAAPVPEGVSGEDLAAYCLMLGDDALILSHRLQEWCTSAPELEEEVALANIALDLLGQARVLYSRAGVADGTGRSEDDYAYWRGPDEFRNVRLVEEPNGDFAECVARLFVFSTWRLAIMQRLRGSIDPVLSALAARAVNELAYHREYAAGWMVRLGDGTPYSAERMERGFWSVCALAVPELFESHPVEQRLAAAGVAVVPDDVAEDYDASVSEILRAGHLTLPFLSGTMGEWGREGQHSDALISLLEDLQRVARAHPGATW
jgi:ring-1,2-phenylacetyl-CoA epoxidase subunit PaaC